MMSTAQKHLETTFKLKDFKNVCRTIFSTHPNFTVSENEKGFLLKDSNAVWSILNTSNRAKSKVEYIGNGTISIFVDVFGWGPIQQNHATEICNTLECMIKSAENQYVSNRSYAENDSTDVVEQLRKLAQLKTEGILSDDEFILMKKSLLKNV